MQYVNAGQGNGWGGIRWGGGHGSAAGDLMLGHMEGREHTVRVSPTQGVPYINGID
jgi:hypothetical protein